MELGERKQKILAAIIDAYIQTGEPVGSKALVEMLDNAVSSATIRNDMADLAAAGYLEQPHTSAGRIPTARAFRLYIDSLMRRQTLSEKRRPGNRGYAGRGCGRPGSGSLRWPPRHWPPSPVGAAVTTTPDQQGSTIRRIEVMRSGSRSAALLLMTSSGVLRSRLCRFECEADGPLLDRLSKTLNAEFLDQPLADVGLAQVQSLLVALGEYGLACAPRLRLSWSWFRIRPRRRCSFPGS